MIPIVMPMNSGGGGRIQDLFAALILVNFVCIIWFFIAYLVYRKQRDLRDFFFPSDFMMPQSSTIRTIIFCTTNGLAISVWLIGIISKYL